MRTEISRRIAGEMVTVAVTIGVLEAVAEIEPRLFVAADALRLGHYRLVRAVVVAGAKAAGRADPDSWFDALVERAGAGEFVKLAFEALSDALVKAGAEAKKDPAAVEAGPEAPTVPTGMPAIPS